MPGRGQHAEGMNPLGQEILRLMQRRGIRSSRELGKKAGVSPRTIDRWTEVGWQMAREPSAEVLERVASALQVPTALLLRRVAEARDFPRNDDLSQQQQTVLMLMGDLSDDAQTAVLDVVLTMVHGLQAAAAVPVPAGATAVSDDGVPYNGDAALERIEATDGLSDRTRGRLKAQVVHDFGNVPQPPARDEHDEVFGDTIQPSRTDSSC